MKTISLLLLFAIAIASCTTDEITGGTSSPDVNSTIKNRDWGLNWTWFDRGPNDFGCESPAANCYDPITVDTSHNLTISNVYDNFETWTPTQLGTYLNSNKNVFYSYLGNDATNGLINGTYTLTIKGTAFSASRHWITKSGSTVVSVSPILN